MAKYRVAPALSMAWLAHRAFLRHSSISHQNEAKHLFEFEIEKIKTKKKRATGWTCLVAVGYFRCWILLDVQHNTQFS